MARLLSSVTLPFPCSHQATSRQNTHRAGATPHCPPTPSPSCTVCQGTTPWLSAFPAQGRHSPMCVWARTSASLCAAPLLPLCVEDEEVVDVVEPWMAWLIQCSMLMLPWLEVGVPWESPCTEPSSSEPEEVSVGKSGLPGCSEAAHRSDPVDKASLTHQRPATSPIHSTSQ